MNTKMIVCLFVAALLSNAPIVEAQQSKKVRVSNIYWSDIQWFGPLGVVQDRSHVGVFGALSGKCNVTLVRVCRLLRLGAVSRGSS